MTDTHRLTGPDFLDAMANQNAASGLDVNAAEFRQRGRDWQADLQRIEALEAQVAHLQRQLRTADDQARVLDDIKKTLQAANDSPARATAAPAA
ncbi:hypothetical protein [uncultured Luteimonas sp.]|uniref:hypothetical protein n=1 Tax=uncultured Luteimonas sp. TaxID=453144 RepID=UPI002635F2EF|nr:hypothetical protein [uncultured Luteimonas sp.]